MPPTQSQGVGTSLNSILVIMLPASLVVIYVAMLGAYSVQIRRRFGFGRSGQSSGAEKNLQQGNPASDQAMPATSSSRRRDTLQSIKNGAADMRRRLTQRGPQDRTSTIDLEHGRDLASSRGAIGMTGAQQVEETITKKSRKA